MQDQIYCAACQTLSPVVRQAAGKAVGSIAGMMFGAATKSAAGVILVGLIGLLVGHWVDEELQQVCGRCRAPLPADVKL